MCLFWFEHWSNTVENRYVTWLVDFLRVIRSWLSTSVLDELTIISLALTHWGLESNFMWMNINVQMELTLYSELIEPMHHNKPNICSEFIWITWNLMSIVWEKPLNLITSSILGLVDCIWPCLGQKQYQPNQSRTTLCMPNNFQEL